MPPRRDLEQGDIAARQLFGGINQFPTFGSLAQTAQRLQNVIPSPSSLAATGISALRNIAASTPLIGRRTPMVQPTAPSAPQLPSGTIAGGFDIYPTTPQMTPRTASATAPQPAAPSLAAPTTVPTFPATGMGLMGNQNIRPLPIEQIAPMASISRIEGGPASMNIAGPITAEAQGRQPIQTPQGTLYATAQQAAAFNAPRTVDTASSRTPAQQQALLAQMRQRGAEIARGNITAQEKFFAQKREERAFQPYSPTPTTIAGIQREFQQFRDLGNRTPTQYAANRGMGGSVYSTTPFAQARGREALAGFASGTAPRFSQQTLTAMRGGGPQPEERIAGLGLRSPFSNYG